MLPTTQALYLTTGPLALFLVGLDSIPAFRSITDRIWRRSSPAEEHTLAKTVYRDEDGEATEESLRAFSDKWQRYGIALFTATGFLVTLALAVFTTFQYIDFTILNWLQVGIWILLSVQAVAFFTEPRPVQRFDLGQYAFVGSLISLATTGIEARLALSSRNPLSREQIWIGLIIAQASSSLLRGLLCILLPRKPDVFLDGRLVDRERTVSALGRFTYSWANSLLGYAVKNKTLELTDLPKLRAEKRTDRLRENFEKSRGNRPIWKALVVAHWKSLLLQLFLTFVLCVLSFGPQTALFNILRTLEDREQNSWHPVQALLWVLGLGGLLLLQSSIEAWVFWSVCSKLFVPIYAELSATVFAKSMRRKDAKHTKKSKKTDAAQESAKALLADEEGDDEDDEAAMKKSRQSIINLAAVDARRISDFTSFSYLIPLSIFKVVIGCTFLVQILGWQPAFSGMAVSVLITPLNVYAAKRFTNAQDRLMKLRDSKMAVVTEVLQGIRQIKFSALEEQWQKKIGQARAAELNALWISFLFDVVLMAIWILGPLGLSAVSLTVYAVMNGGLNASVAFTAMSIFGALELSLAILPEIIADGLEAKISADRIGVYMASEEKIVNTIPADRISFEGASVAWPAEQSQLVDNDEEPRFTLQDLDLHFPNKGLSVISGRTGSGKSLLLASILGECDILQGAINVPVPPSITARFDHAANPENWIIDSAIAYVAQIPWIENATIKSNILFGLPCDEERYQKVLVACALKKDLEMLADGDLTDIGANGVNLSGGQRWRVSFARALYSRAGILIMDDIFSALDAHTGRYVYQNALTGELGKGRTRILVTHHVALCLPRTDYSVLLENGCVKYAGTIEELQKSNHLDDILREEQAAGEADRNVETEETEDLLNPEETGLQKVISNTPHQPPPDQAQNGDAIPKKADPKKFVEDEKREVGSISLSVYKQYFAMAFNPFMFVFTTVIFLSYATLMIGRGYWMNVWASDSPTTQVHSEQLYTPFQQSMISSTNAHEDKLMMYLSVYIGISLLATILGTARYYFIFSASLRASKNFFDRLTFAVLRAPLRWLDTVPLGRILNRFTSDFHLIDSRIGYDLAFFIGAMLEVCGVMVAGFLVSPLVIFLASILLIFCLKLSLTYLAGAREIKRLESTAKSPVFEQFGSSLAGLITIRAFTKTDTFINIIYDKINDHAQAWWAMWLFNRWLSIRMNLISAIFSTITAALVVFLPGISAPLAGFALSFALQCNAAITFALRHYANIELNMNATERVMEYSNIELENQGGADAPAAWPTEGRLEVNDLVVGYAPDLPPILKGLSFTVEKNQRVGVVGRTGAGKSSLTLALFRFLEARQGQILIDGLDVSKIKLQDLRSRLAIIPQDPVLFSGTVRSNLDPFEEYEDGELYDALARVHLIASSDDDATLTSQAATPRQSSGTGSSTPDTATVQHANANVFTSLSASISEGGLNLSQGQRQLLCLARAIVARPKLMVLDEATSAVDMETDALIQQSIRAEFGRNATTLLVIAHRLSTIADFDRILVMDAGKAVEFGSPKELMGIEDGVFKNLVDNSGEKAVLEKMIFE